MKAIIKRLQVTHMNSLSLKFQPFFYFMYFSSPSLIAFQLSYSCWSFNSYTYSNIFLRIRTLNQNQLLCLNLNSNINKKSNTIISEHYCKNPLNVYALASLSFNSLPITYASRANWRQVHVFKGKAIYKIIFFHSFFCIDKIPWEL